MPTRKRQIPISSHRFEDLVPCPRMASAKRQAGVLNRETDVSIVLITYPHHCYLGQVLKCPVPVMWSDESVKVLSLNYGTAISVILADPGFMTPNGKTPALPALAIQSRPAS